MEGRKVKMLAEKDVVEDLSREGESYDLDAWLGSVTWEGYS